MAWTWSLILLVVGFGLPAVAPATVWASADEHVDRAPRNVILFISDGCGPASFTLARSALKRPLALDPYQVGSSSTQASDTWVTDSAASGTALARVS